MIKLLLSLLIFGLSYGADLLDVGSQAKKFYLMDTQGKRQGYKNYFQNQTSSSAQATILSFWSTSCIPCRKEMPALEAFVQKHPQYRLVFINLDAKSNRAQVDAFIKKYSIQSTVLLDYYQTTGKNFGVCEAKVCSVPALYLINPQGQILLSQSGYDPLKDDIEAKILQVDLSRSPVPASTENSQSLKKVHCLALQSALHQSNLKKIAQKSKDSLSNTRASLKQLQQKHCPK